MSYITSIGTASPKNKFSQGQIADFMIKAMHLPEEEANQLKVLYRASGINSRYSVLSDYGNHNDQEFYKNADQVNSFPTTKGRLELFQKESVLLSKKAVLNCFQKASTFDVKSITHLIAVSCTGMFAPGLDIKLIHELKLSPNVQRTSINFMGCYAAFNAMRLANAFCDQSKKAKVLIVCTELCSIHFQKENTDDNKLANALFADGSAALLIESQARNGINLKIGSFFCDLAPEGGNDMAWTIGDNGFEMKLSSYVPEVIKNGISQLTRSLLSENKIKLTDISYYAIHPGGKKILEAIEERLGLTKKDNSFAYRILKEYGNMSSPTILFVLDKILSDLTPNDHDKKILSFGFGPGLTLESLILTVKSENES